MNGRVLFNDKPGISYDLFENGRNPEPIKNPFQGIQDSSVLSRKFFSKQNIDFLQRQIIMNVVSSAGFKINRQNDTELQIIMRSIYLQYSKNLNCNYKGQIEMLNNKVLDYSVGEVIKNIKAYLGYKKRVNELPIPLLHPQNLSNSGSKTLSPRHFI